MAESTWRVTESEQLTFDDRVTTLDVRLVNGRVNVVGTDEALPHRRGGTKLEISGVEGPPLIVTLDGSTLTVAYEDLAWKSLLDWLDPKGRRRSAVVTLAVPTGTAVEVGAVGAETVITGIRGRTAVRGVSGDTTLVGLSGEVRAETVSGDLEAQAVTGSLHYHSVSGSLTVVEGSGSRVRADSVSGDMVIDLDLDPAGEPTDISLNTVSGEVAIRLPHPTDAQVEANTASGSVTNAFDDLRVSGRWGAHKITGTLGAGAGTVRANTVSGAIALLRKPPSEDAPHDGPHGPAPAGAAPSLTKEL
ncbi:DUF4097 family beta strand repeat-containing protein [Streptomyces sp. NPDC050509]|uniref:DUF4097 family beta strand repeat-containing protein n=1 Tax=Streptomyces sp. NPDC050509 TaxID=3365620 RepID=UPI0037950E1E